MVNDPLTALTQRLDRLEQETRRWKRLGVAALAGLTALVLMGQTPSSPPAKVLEAEQFVVRDASGRVIAELGGDRGMPSLLLRDDAGKVRIALSVSGSVPFLTFRDRDGLIRAMLSILPDDTPSLSFWAKDARRIWFAP